MAIRKTSPDDPSRKNLQLANWRRSLTATSLPRLKLISTNHLRNRRTTSSRRGQRTMMERSQLSSRRRRERRRGRSRSARTR